MILFMRHRSNLGWCLAGLLAGGALFWKYQVTHLEHLADLGDAKAEYALATRYWAGQMVRQDRAEALKWVDKAAEAGLPEAQATLGLLYVAGEEVLQDDLRGLYWLRRAASKGSGLAQNQLGLMYAQGQGVSANLETAVSWFKKAIEGGSEKAIQNLALVRAAQVHFNRLSISLDGKSRMVDRVKKVDAKGVLVAFEPTHGGIGLEKVDVESLPADLQRRFGAALVPRLACSSSLTQLGWDVAQR
jgi:hypothetical protein